MSQQAPLTRRDRVCKALGFPPDPFKRAPHKSAYEVLFHTRLEISYFFSISFALWFYLGMCPFLPDQEQEGALKAAILSIFLLVSRSYPFLFLFLFCSLHNTFLLIVSHRIFTPLQYILKFTTDYSTGIYDS